MKEAACPICDKEIQCLERYNNLLCGDCASRAIDEDGNKVTFYNISFSGGIVAHHALAGEVKEDSEMTCFVDGIKCEGMELRFGGTAIMKV